MVLKLAMLTVIATKKAQEYEPPCATKLYHCFLQRKV
jgi:hypothetical protein